MGNSSVKGPKTEKVFYDGQNNILKFGVCEMQGWRNNMVNINILSAQEDATIYSVDYEQNASIFGVLDGHGGKINFLPEKKVP